MHKNRGGLLQALHRGAILSVPASIPRQPAAPALTQIRAQSDRATGEDILRRRVDPITLHVRCSLRQMNIGIIIGRIGDVDGVALETEKWIHVLEKLGHTVFLLSGRFKEDFVPKERQTLLRLLSFFSPECEWEQNRAFFFPPDDPDELMSHIHEHASIVANTIFSWVIKNRLETILVENASALPCHLSMGLGIKIAVERMHIPVITHDHDFSWERGDRYKSPFPEIQHLVETAFPLQLPHVRHCVINSNAKSELRERFDIDALVVPNVMDFSKVYALKDDYNSDLPASLGLAADDIPLFQITRIVERKGIEVAIDLVDRLDDSRVKLVVTGSAADDARKGYFKKLKREITARGLTKQVLFAYHKILSHRESGPDGSKIYSLSDAYANATACTYFSTYEGFGNAFVEAVLAKKPVFVNNYKPVFWPDIGSKGFHCVLLEDNDLTDDSVAEISSIIHDPDLQRDIAEHNFALGRKYFSYDVLEEKLNQVLTT